MLEIKDEQLGQIKILNVTEVRAHFADVISDQNANYIITKNNRPQRVIISYDDFEKLKSYLKNESPVKSVVIKKEDTTVDFEAEESKTAKKKKSPESIRGLLADRIEQAYKKPEPKPVEKKQVVADETIWMSPQEKEAAIQPYLNPPEEKEVMVQKETQLASLESESASIESDYFNSSDSFDDEIAEKILLSPDEDELTPLPATESEIFNQEALLTETPIIKVEEKPAPKKEPEVLVKKEEVKRKTSNPVLTQKQKEDRDYFERYKKLYEPFSESNANIVVSETKLENPEPEQNQLFEKLYRSKATSSDAKSTAETIKKAYVPSPQTQPDAKISDNFLPKMEKEPSSVAIPEKVIVKAEKKEGYLPSLQDLLKELDAEKLSGDEAVSMDDQEIDDLINRITHD